MDELNALPFLDAVVREVLRIHPPVPFVYRIAIEDDIIPLDYCVNTRTGEKLTSIR